MLLKSIKYCGNDKESVLDYNKSSNNKYKNKIIKLVCIKVHFIKL